MFAVLTLAFVLAAPQDSATEVRRDELEQFQKELVAALREGDRATLERYLADGFTFVHSTGGFDTREVYIDNLVTSAKAGRKTDVERLGIDAISMHGDHTAVVTSRGIVRRGAEETLLRSTHVYVKIGGQWKWAGGQSTRLPTRPKAAVTISPEMRNAYAGRYEVSPGRTLTVRTEGDLLRVALPGFRDAELIARSDSEFAWFNPEMNIESQLRFERDDKGVVIAAIYRRDGRDVWRALRLP